MKSFQPPIALVAALVAAACSSAPPAPPASSTDQEASAPSTSRSDLPPPAPTAAVATDGEESPPPGRGRGDIVLRIHRGAGSSMDMLGTLTKPPLVTLYADGAAVLFLEAPGEMKDWPHSKMLSLRLKAEGVSRARAEAATAGLLDAAEQHLKTMANLADSGVTRFTLRTDKGRFVTTASDLGKADTHLREGGDLPSRRRRAAAYLEWLLTMPTWPEVAEAAMPYQPERVAVWSVTLRNWPGELPLWPLPLGPNMDAGRTPARCYLAAGKEAKTAENTLAKAVEKTAQSGRPKNVFRAGVEGTQEEQLLVMLRPLLPDELSCAAPAVTAFQ